MIKSMTGFGAVSASTSLGKFTVEIKTVNSRFLDFSFRMPNVLNFIELNLRELISHEIKRGKVDFFLKWEQGSAYQPQVQLNTQAIDNFYREYNRIAKHLKLNQQLSLEAVLQMPGTTMISTPEIDEEKCWHVVRKLTSQALKSLLEFRRQEGRELLKELRQRLRIIEQSIKTLTKRKDDVVKRYRRRLIARAKEFLRESKYIIEDSRLQTEVLIYADKSDITEELVRLRSHLDAFRKNLASKTREPVGKSLEFLTQELLREVNTIGSKARETVVASKVLLMKNEIEKIREQIQNVE